MPDLPAPPRETFTIEPEIAVGRRCFATAQGLFSGAAIGPESLMVLGWYDTSTHPEIGSFACVAAGAGLDDLIGEIVRVTYDTRRVFAYVLQDVPLPEGVQLGLTRRTYAAIARLSLETVSANVVVAVQ